ncbi:MAG: hypothetical protein NZ898_12125 [Myxococcota bacterium]|nr:hypothetical protein [Myxococcota bacterium]MDW8362126.1 hypothetical protein [Myxococcales bacterium]
MTATGVRGDRARRAGVVIFVGWLAGTAVATRAQDGEPTAQQRQAAAEAYDRGAAAFLARDWATAAHWFETANRLVPAAPALVQAIRAHERAGNVLRAATLAIRLEARHANDRSARRVYEPLLRRAERAYGRLDVVCEGCTVEVDGVLLEHPSFFVEPGTEVRVVARFRTGDVEQHVSLTAGERRELRVEAPAPPPSPPPVSQTPEQPVPAPAQATTPVSDVTTNERDGLSPVFFWTGLGLTVAAGGVLLWSGLDTLAGVDDYEANPTPEGLQRGQAREMRTNVLIGVTAALGVGTAVLALLTDFDGSHRRERAGFTGWHATVGPGAVGVAWVGRWP